METKRGYSITTYLKGNYLAHNHEIYKTPQGTTSQNVHQNEWV